MWLLFLFGLLVVVAAGRESYERIGYFWHITDIHYDARYNFHGDARKGCWRPDYDGNVGSRAQRRPMGRYGDYSCDATWELIESAARTMMTRQNDNVEFVLWTGDALSHAARRLQETRQIELLQNLTDLLRKTFSSQFVFPALGHDDPTDRKELGNMWSRWLPTDSMKTFETGGYYIIERKQLKLQIVVLNTNLMKKNDNNDDAAAKQWDWLEKVLNKFQRNEETVYLVGHMAPGSNERQRGPAQAHAMFSDHNNKRYLKLVRKYAAIIVGQFFGHLHSDTFRVIYGENGRPVSWAMLAPSITPRRTNDGPNNPGLRIYKFDKDTGQVFDYTQYYLDLSSVNINSKREAEWVVEYNFSSYYSINDINAVNLNLLAEKLTQQNPNDNAPFNRYYRANAVRINNNPQTSCDTNCAHLHYCAITRVDYDEYAQCLKTAASALSSSTTSTLRPAAAVVALLAAIVIYRV
ncbi:acid sphingomyelinase-like phosphodiesterase 3b [Aethina tumida]|uniref:acid sphingomyelinase-like phosphodiesterase 3b n=1 Tax=Aethina tumida TaxID=116153 RepID=UPI0021488A23|nr:acid sphingomyelinase-like phosphodiesterase 3b [Aethina tumida]